jgi:hypothetical protein
MSRSYPIWNDVTACIYGGSKSWGAKEVSEVTVKVGSSASNSHEFVHHATKKVVTDEHVIFNFYVDSIKVKEVIFENKSGKAGEMLESNLFINQKSK